MPDVVRMTGRSESSIKRDMGEGKFPKPIKLGARAIGWRAAVVKAWIADREQRNSR